MSKKQEPKAAPAKPAEQPADHQCHHDVLLHPHKHPGRARRRHHARELAVLTEGK